MRHHYFRLKQRIESWKSGRSWNEVLDQYFDVIAVFKQDGERRKEISISINEGLQNMRLYWITTILSVLIAAFGLLQNSVAVIIGAMLIAPLMDPIQAMAFGVATGRSKLFWRSLRMIINSIIISILLAYIVCLFAPIRSETSEVIARTSPNLFDLFIAVFSAAVAFLAHGFSRLSKSVAGVAMAASLMPPLAVVGIEICFGSWSLAWGGFLLFITNLVAILLVGTLMFLFYGFNPHQEQTTKTIERIGLLVILVFIIGIPLKSGIEQINTSRQIQIYTQETLSQTLDELVPKAEIQNLQVHQISEQKLKIVGEIKLPENVSLFTEIMDEISKQMSVKLEKDINLELDIVRTASVISKQQTYSLKNDIENNTRTIFKELWEQSIILKLEAVHIPSETALSSWSIKTVYALPEGKYLTDQDKEDLEDRVIMEFPEETLHFLWFPVSKREIAPQTEIKTEAIDPEAFIQEELLQQWNQFLSDQSTESMTFENLKIQWKYIASPIVEGLFDEVPEEGEEILTEKEIESLEALDPRTLVATLVDGIASDEETPPTSPLNQIARSDIPKIINISFDIYVEATQTDALQRFTQALEVFKNSFDLDEVNVKYRVFEYQTALNQISPPQEEIKTVEDY